MRSSQKVFALWMVGAVLVWLIYQTMGQQGKGVRNFDYATFRKAVAENKIEGVTFRQDSSEIRGVIKDQFVNEFQGKNFVIVGNTSDNVEKWLIEHGITPNYEKAESNDFLQSLLINWLPMILVIALFMFFIRQLQAGGGKAMSFGKSRARLLTENKNRVTFKDVAGVDEAKEELVEIVNFLRDPKKYTRLGGRIPKGVLLVGPPGTGKTLLARAVAGEAGVPFFTISGSDFVEMFVGVGASRVRDLFEQGKKNAPCLIFIDEIDAVGRHRGAGMGGGHDEREQTLNQLLVEMDGFESNDGVILIAATNRPDVLDPALLRPGRFDRRVVVNKPDLNGRLAILEVHAKRTPLAGEVDLEKVARGTPGFSGADLENLVNEAALIAARDNKNKLDMLDFERARDKVLMGSERRSMVISEKDKKITAYHEAGHALVAKMLPGGDPLHKVTIIPRGMALGITMTLPQQDRLNLSKTEAKNMIAYAFGGRAAEELVFNEITTGAGNDIERATELARSMVCEWGMSDVLGPLAYDKREGPVFLGLQGNRAREYSDAKAQEIDQEVSRLVQEGYDRACSILKDNRAALDAIAEALLEKETIDGEDVDILVRGGNLADLRDREERRAKGLAEENRLAAALADEAELTEAKKAEDSSSDPVGSPPPVTA